MENLPLESDLPLLAGRNAADRERRSKWPVWVGTFDEAEAEDARQWLALTPIERLQALEDIRAANYGYAEEDQPRPEFQRVYRVAELGEG